MEFQKHEVEKTEKIEKQVGTVSWFSDRLGYGFITPESGAKDVFVHFSGIEMKGYKTLKEGEQVSFVVGYGRNGAQAEEVERL